MRLCNVRMPFQLKLKDSFLFNNTCILVTDFSPGTVDIFLKKQ